jgi:hypothetical protein
MVKANIFYIGVNSTRIAQLKFNLAKNSIPQKHLPKTIFKQFLKTIKRVQYNL